MRIRPSQDTPIVRRALPIYALLAASSTAALSGEPTPERAAIAFLNAYEPLGAGGLPPLKRMTSLLKYSSPDLSTLLNKAATLEEASRCEGPPTIEGDLLWSLAEGAQSWTLGQCKASDGHAVCEVTLRHSDPKPSVNTLVWAEELVLVRSSHAWLVDNVRSTATWATNRQLKDRLRTSIQQNEQCAR